MSAMLAQELGDGIAAAVCCRPQRRIIVGMHVSAVLEEERHHIHVTTPRCFLQRCMIVSVHVSAMMEEERDHTSVATRSGHPQRPVNVSMLLHVRAGLEEERDSVGLTHGSGLTKGPAIGTAGQVGAVLDEKRHHIRVTILNRT